MKLYFVLFVIFKQFCLYILCLCVYCASHLRENKYIPKFSQQFSLLAINFPSASVWKDRHSTKLSCV